MKRDGGHSLQPWVISGIVFALFLALIGGFLHVLRSDKEGERKFYVAKIELVKPGQEPVRAPAPTRETERETLR